MRVLVVTQAEKTHMLSMIPLAWALRAAGHEVQVASQPTLTDAILETGLPASLVGDNHVLYQYLTFHTFLQDAFTGEEEDEGFDMGSVDRPETLGWEYLRDGYRDFVPWWWKIVNDPMLDDLVTLTRSWKPDLVLWEPTAFAASIAAEACGAMHARFLWGMDVTGRMRAAFLRRMVEQPPEEQEDLLADWLGERAARYGVEFSESLVRGHATVDPCPKTLRLEPEPQARHLPVRYIPYNGRAEVPEWLRGAAERPRVCLTLGASTTQRFDSGRMRSIAELLTELARLDAEIVATLPAEQAEELGPLPDNIRIVQYVPLHVLMTDCAAVVHHGGAGTYLTALYHGVPQLILADLVMPRYQFDESLLARGLVAQGAGLQLPGTEMSAGAVAEAVGRLLTDPSFRHRAARLRAEVLDMPSPVDLVPVLEELVAAHRTEGAVTSEGRDARVPGPS
ncbi:activator-dependent family glycosyltransferase [Nocardiopsis ansamitocini]|uniref:Glycosyl transferase n=1 Tax=Nocardiopsis ansamitocini TaxID=1670832 RepID=A0A9W6PAJ3_9ACTN|nr:activator-dependent family glycosyltransferase [Nocardiopsis ansamitocini]GLU50022.1 glycosyl transferase [Nocardiopsis ansamitocini]